MDVPSRSRRYLPARSLRRGLRAGRRAFGWEWVRLSIKRRLVDHAASLLRVPSDVAVTHTVHNRVECWDFLPAGAERDCCLLYLHGGGYAVGSARGYRGFVAQYARRLRWPAVSVEYALAPEHVYPEALYQVRDVYLDLVRSGVDPARIVVSGDSAGGGMSLALAMLLRDAELPLPGALALICPWVDLAADIEGRREERPDALISAALSQRWAPAYVGDADPKLPGISPLHGNLAGLPPMLIHSAGDDPLQIDSDQLLDRLSRTPGAVAEHHRWAGEWHVFQLTAAVHDRADEALDQMVDWVHHRIGPVAD